MSPVVRIPDEVFERLQKLAVPLVDSVGDVILRLLNEHDHRSPAPTSPDRGVVASDQTRLSADSPVTSNGGDMVHPDYARAPKGSCSLHDQVKELLIREFDAELRVDQRTLVFRSGGRNFAAIQRLGLRDEVLDLSIFGERSAFDDPRRLISSGRFPHWSKIRIDHQTNLADVLLILRQSHAIRMRRPARDT